MITAQQISVPKRRELWKPECVRAYARDDIAGAKRAFSDDELRRATVPALAIAVNAAVPVTATATDPLTLITSKTPFFFLSGDVGVIEVAGAGQGVSTWTDQSGQTKNATQTSNVTFRPAYNATGGPNSRGLVTFDAVNDYLEFATWDPPAPGTTPIWFAGAIKANAHTNGSNIYSGSTTAILRLRQGVSTGMVGASNTTLGQEITALTVGSYFRFENLFSNSTGDYVKVGATKTTIPGTNTGNTNAGSGVFRMCTDALARFGSIAWLWFGAWNGEPTSGEKALVDGWNTTWYGATVGV